MGAAAFVALRGGGLGYHAGMRTPSLPAAFKKRAAALGAHGLFLLVIYAGATLAVPGCRSAGPKGAPAQRVVMVSYDGVGADLAWDWLANGVLTQPNGVSAMVRHGLAARRLRMVNPTLTAVNHISLVTGALPEVTGIVSNRFHLPGTPFLQTVSGFSAPIGAETLWQAARRTGKRVGVLTWPGADDASPERRGDFGLVWPSRPLKAQGILELTPAKAGMGSVLPSADGLPPLVWTVTMKLPKADPEAVRFTVTAVDGNADGLRMYDTLAVQAPGSDEPQILARERWFPVRFTARGAADDGPHPYGAWCKVLHLDRHNGGVRLYRGAAYRVIGYPAAFEDAVAADVGFWPGPPDNHALGEWWLDMGRGIDLDTYLEQLERLDRYLDRVAAYVAGHERFDLLLAYHPTPDEYEHAALIVDKRQWAWSPGTALAAAEGLKRVGRSFDRSVAAMAALLDPARDDLFVVSDHGHLPMHDRVSFNQILADAGLLDVDHSRRRARPAATSRIVAVASGGCAHLYLNLQDREPHGTVGMAQAEDVLRRAARALADVDADGEPVVEKIFTRGQAAAIGLASPNSGDLIVFLRPGYGASSRLDGKQVEPSREYGEHGYLSTHDPLCGILFASGAGISHRRVKELPATAVAPMVARRAGFRLSAAR